MSLLPMRRPRLWLRLAANAPATPDDPPLVRERARRSELCAWILLGLLAIDLLLIPTTLDDLGSRIAVGGVFCGCLLAVWLNRHGEVLGAGLLTVLVVHLAVTGAIAGYTGGLTVDVLGLFYLYAIVPIVGASILPRTAVWPLLGTVVATIVGLYVALPHASDLVALLRTGYAGTAGDVIMVTRPIVLATIVSVVAFLWVRGTDQATVSQYQAEEVAGQATAQAVQAEQWQHYADDLVARVIAVEKQRAAGIHAFLELDHQPPTTDVERTIPLYMRHLADRLNDAWHAADQRQARIASNRSQQEWINAHIVAYLQQLARAIYRAATVPKPAGGAQLLHPSRFGNTGLPLVDTVTALVYAVAAHDRDREAWPYAERLYVEFERLLQQQAAPAPAAPHPAAPATEPSPRRGAASGASARSSPNLFGATTGPLPDPPAGAAWPDLGAPPGRDSYQEEARPGW